MDVYGCISELLFSVARPFLNRKYHEGNDQRYGYYGKDVPVGALWVHAVSVGEVQSAYPFIRTVRAQEPSLAVLLSTITETGRQMSEQLLKERVSRIYYPWDAPSVLNRALDTLRPKAYVTMETEIWPEMLLQLRKRRIPAFLVNGRLSESSFRKYHRLKNFWKKVIRRYSLIMVRTEDDRSRFLRLGADPDKVIVTGDCKIDALIERRKNADVSQVAAFFSAKRPAILAGSTHEGEETPVLQAYTKLLKGYPKLQLVLAPRHPERAAGLAAQAREAGFSGVRLMSEIGPSAEKTEWDVLIVDRIGVLFPLYGCVKAAFLGGSLVPKGGQNILEPALWALPFCQGPDYRDFAAATDAMTSAGICTIIHDAAEMERFFDGVLSGGLPERSAACRTFFETHGGASGRSWELIRNFTGSFSD